MHGSHGVGERGAAEWDLVFDALSDGRRRRVLSFLGRTPETRMADLVEELTRTAPTRSPATTPAPADPGARPGRLAEGVPDRRAIELALHHVHLPKLVESGFVEWDRATGRVGLVAAPPFPVEAIPEP